MQPAIKGNNDASVMLNRSLRGGLISTSQISVTVYLSLD